MEASDVTSPGWSAEGRAVISRRMSAMRRDGSGIDGSGTVIGSSDAPS